MSAVDLIAFRVDAGVTVGLGHVSRCLTLANSLRQRGARSVFLVSPETCNWSGLITSQGFEVSILDPDGRVEQPSALAHADWLAWGQMADADACRKQLREKPAWLVVDHYALDENWEMAMRSSAERLMAIDDLADRKHCCDALLDQNLKDPTSYRQLVSAQCVTLIGPVFALLRPEFAVAGSAQRTGKAARINIFMGGTDSEGATVRVLDDLDSDVRWEKLDVILGRKSPHLDTVRDRVAQLPNAELHVDSASVASLFASADIGIGAGGVAALERCCVGLPSLCICVAANQNAGLTSLLNEGVIDLAGSLKDFRRGQIAERLRSLMSSPERLRKMSSKAMALVDGLGASRVATLMLAN
jgi:UDP-2,4-diacetamido-2,4,6-trideoxy-beta-L-altropyranose hydrolase